MLFIIFTVKWLDSSVVEYSFCMPKVLGSILLGDNFFFKLFFVFYGGLGFESWSEMIIFSIFQNFEKELLSMSFYYPIELWFHFKNLGGIRFRPKSPCPLDSAHCDVFFKSLIHNVIKAKAEMKVSLTFGGLSIF